MSKDVREEFVRDFASMFRAMRRPKGHYTCWAPRSLGRWISKRLVEVAPKPEPMLVAHGATGKRNDFMVVSNWCLCLGNP